MTQRTTRSNGRASRRRILDAATELASARGFEGTSISAVSKRSGLPASSIYWHFADKDALFTAMIEDSYEQWLERLEQSADADTETGESSFERTYASLAACPEFVRLGLMLTLEQAPSGGRSARERFLEIRQSTLERLTAMLVRDHPGLDQYQAELLAAITLAMIDGTFVGAVAGEEIPPPRLLSAAVRWLATGAIDQSLLSSLS